MKKLAFTPEPEIAARLEKLCEITNLDLDQLLNTLLDSPLGQIVKDGDTGYLQCLFFEGYEFDSKEDALKDIARYDAFVAELKAAGNRCYHDDARAARTRDGHWEIRFKSTDPRPADFLGNGLPDDGANWWKSA